MKLDMSYQCAANIRRYCHYLFYPSMENQVPSANSSFLHRSISFIQKMIIVGTCTRCDLIFALFCSILDQNHMFVFYPKEYSKIMKMSKILQKSSYFLIEKNGNNKHNMTYIGIYITMKSPISLKYDKVSIKFDNNQFSLNDYKVLMKVTLWIIRFCPKINSFYWFL